MKIKTIFIVALAICLSSSLASATTILGGASGEADLWDIASAMCGVAVGTITQDDLQGLTPIATLGSGKYLVTNLARQAGFNPQGLGYYTAGTPAAKTFIVASVASSTNTPVSLPFAPVTSFGFFEDVTGSGQGFKYTELALNVPVTNPVQSNGLILDLGKLNKAGVSGLLIAFEDGDGAQATLGDKDYNDLVGKVNAVPVPGAVLLLGAGMARLAAYARRRREE